MFNFDMIATANSPPRPSDLEVFFLRFCFFQIAEDAARSRLALPSHLKNR